VENPVLIHQLIAVGWLASGLVSALSIRFWFEREPQSLLTWFGAICTGPLMLVFLLFVAVLSLLDDIRF